MTRVLLVGYDPETVDFSNTALPPGMTVEKIRAVRHLASASCDCVVIGAGVRLPPQGLVLFEAVVNAVHRAAPAATIAFNTRPEDSADAAARWLPPG
jgi:hypothetical protein